MNRPSHVYSWQRHYNIESRWHCRVPRWLCWEMPWQHFKRIWRHEKERVNHGYSWNDWISFDTFLCQVIADAAKDFRERGVGYPMGMQEEEWHDILTRIEEPLRWWAEKKFDNNLDFKGEMAKYEEAKEAMRLVADHLGNLWD